MITQRSTYQAENWTSNTKKPHQVIPQSYFRYEPISPSYDPNEFVKNYNKKSHQKFRQLPPAKKRPYRWIFEFFLRDDVECSQISALVKIKTKNSMKFWSKNSPQSRKNQWFSMKFIKNLARPLLLDFAGALKKTFFVKEKYKAFFMISREAKKQMIFLCWDDIVLDRPPIDVYITYSVYWGTIG